MFSASVGCGSGMFSCVLFQQRTVIDFNNYFDWKGRLLDCRVYYWLGCMQYYLSSGVSFGAWAPFGMLIGTSVGYFVGHHWKSDLFISLIFSWQLVFLQISIPRPRYRYAPLGLLSPILGLPGAAWYLLISLDPQLALESILHLQWDVAIKIKVLVLEYLMLVTKI